MVGILTIILAFFFFMIILDKAWLATLRPVSFAILIIVSLFLGYIFASIIAWLLEEALKVIVIIVIIIAIIWLFSKKE